MSITEEAQSKIEVQSKAPSLALAESGRNAGQRIPKLTWPTKVDGLRAVDGAG